MNQLNNPHDKFFKETFSRLEVAQSFIEEVFPPDLLERLNLSALKRVNDSFTDAELEEYLADIVYSSINPTFKNILIYSFYSTF
jgi:predicted transposase YdaD